MSTSRFIEARYGDRTSNYLSQEDRTRCEVRQRGIWRALTRLIGVEIDEPWTEEVHSPRALPAFLSAERGGPNLVWDAGLGTMFDHLSFAMPYMQPADVVEATLRRVAAVRCVALGYPEQGSRQVDRAIELLDACPIDRTYQEGVDAESQFEVFLLTEMQERFALAHEFAHYLKCVDEAAFDAVIHRMTYWLNEVLSGEIESGALRTHRRVQWREDAAPSLREAGLDPYAWYLRGSDPDPLEAGWHTLVSDAESALVLLDGCSPSEREEIACDLLGALAVALDAHERERGWTAIAGAACAQLALANLQTILSLDAWVSSSGDHALAGWTATTRQRCLTALLPAALPSILSQSDITSRLGADDIHTVALLVEERFRTRVGHGLIRIDWCNTKEKAYHSSDKILMLATFLPIRAEADHRVVNRAAGGHKFELGNISLSSAIYTLYVSDRSFCEQVSTSIRRHQRGDWGEITQEDRDSNDRGLFEEFEPPLPARLRRRDKLWSLYLIQGEKVLIATSPDRTITEVFFLREY